MRAPLRVPTARTLIQLVFRMLGLGLGSRGLCFRESVI